jgi:hypothetical protein
MTRARRLASETLFWILFFLISAGLGYSTLNRYDPRQQLPDAAVYAQMATEGPRAVESHLRFRVLVPFLARAVWLVSQGHTGSWDALMFSFLVVNTSLIATTTYLLCKAGTTLLASHPVALLGATLYLLNFAVANLQLAGLVDSAEACLLMATVACIFYRRWFLLPAIGVLGALAKESFVPFSITMAVSWWLASGEQKSRRALQWIIIMTVAEVATISVLQSSISGHPVWPWNYALSMSSPMNYGTNLLHSIIDRNSWYILIWLLPLGVAGIKPFPHPWKAAAVAGSVAALILNAYHSTVGGGGGGIGRYIFNVAGPLLSLSSASLLSSRDFVHPQR